MSPHALLDAAGAPPVSRSRSPAAGAVGGCGYTRCWRIRYRANLTEPEQTAT
ncbi:hypothetical protein GCM10010440_03500 [Kitasatospora cinereorecta]